jgi:CRISPR/Cas system-associated exonuclease Cas4 (RecB family)
MRGKMTEHLALGNAIHQSLEDNHRAGTFNLTVAVSQFLKEFRRIINDDEVFVSWPKVKKMESDGAIMLEKYYDQMMRGEFTSHPVAVEEEFSLPFEDEIVVVGKIDKVENDENGLVVIDYKTGSKEPDPWFLRHNLQFTTYAWAAQQKYGKIPDKLIWHHLRTARRLETERTQQDIDELQRMLHNALLMHRLDIRYRIYSEPVCNWCEFKGPICDDRELEQRLLAERESLRALPK